MAVAPGICEELAFRGFVLSGFARSARPSVAIVLSAVAFGVFHIIPQQVFNATLMGLLLGLLAIRSRSLLPGVLFHITYNAIETLRVRAGDSLVRNARGEMVCHEWPSANRVQPLALVTCGGRRNRADRLAGLRRPQGCCPLPKQSKIGRPMNLCRGHWTPEPAVPSQSVNGNDGRSSLRSSSAARTA